MVDVVENKPGVLAGELFLRSFARELPKPMRDEPAIQELLGGEISAEDQQLVDAEGPFLLWTLLGCSSILSNVPDYINSRAAANQAYPRDGRWVAKSSLDIGERTFYNVVRGCVDEIHAKTPVRFVGDIGCGTAGLLCDIVARCDARGVGIDASAGACRAAEALIKERKLGRSVSVVHRDAEALIDDPSPLERADLVMCNFLLHEFEPDVRGPLIRSIASAMSPGGAMVVCEAVTDGHDSQHPFARAFRLVHVVMGQTLSSSIEWHNTFAAAGLEVEKMLDGQMPGTRTFVVRKPKGA